MIETIIFGFGLIFGSFLNVVIYRLPKNEKFGLSRSKCPQCQKTLAWYHNIPVFSFLFLRAKCAFCKNPISWRYPIVELITAVAWLAVYLRFGLTVDCLGYIILLTYLIPISAIDLELQIIPDELSLSGLVVGFVFSFFLTDISVLDSALGILLGGGLFLLVAYLYEKMTKREGLGGGDIKLLGMLGAWFGYQSILTLIVLSSILGTLVGVIYMLLKKKNFQAAIPFGPFIALAGIIYLFCREPLQQFLFPH